MSTPDIYAYGTTLSLPDALPICLAASAGDVSLTGLKGEFAGVELLDCRLALALAGPRPNLRADISAGTLPLAALLAPAADGDKAGKGGNAGSGGGAGTALPASRER